MKGMTLNTSEQMLFALLRASLHQKEAEQAYFQQVSQEDWKLCYRLAARQGVMALAWDGMQYLPTGCSIPRALKITWGLAVQSYEQKYERYCKTAAELSAFYTTHQIGMVQLKGVGFSSYYPIPEHREGGDIDIYTWSMNPNLLSDQEANTLADELMAKQGIDVDAEHSYKHSNFYYKGIPVENHKMFLNRETIPVAGPMNDLLHNILNPETITLCEGKYQIQIPSKEFNALFIPFHAAQHYGSGIRVHHLFDWACILKRHSWCVPPQVSDERLLDFICALTQICNALLDTNVAVKGGETLAQQVYNEMMNPKYPLHTIIPNKNKIGILWFKTKRFFHNYKLMSTVFDMSLYQWIRNSVIAHIKRPETIFSR
jgi:hypothetical protein